MTLDALRLRRTKAVKRRKEIWEALHPVKRAPVCDENNSGQSSPTIPERSAGRPKEFAAETAAITGEAKRTINQHLARAEALGDDLDKVTGTSLDKGVELDARDLRGVLRTLGEAQGP